MIETMTTICYNRIKGECKVEQKEKLTPFIKQKLFRMDKFRVIQGTLSVEDFAKQYEMSVETAQLLAEDWKEVHTRLSYLEKKNGEWERKEIHEAVSERLK